MASQLVIVESPAKAGTIGKYLGPDFEVMASMGHIRDLPASKLGVDVDADFTPQYVIPPKARTTLKNLKAALKGKKRVLLATDLDREGEAIAWHIGQALELAKLPDVEVARITFDEITKDAILAAVAHPREVNIDLVDAQQARRSLDRLVGYTLSPLLWKKIYRGLSAGRVQSVALRLVVDRERERQAFVPVEYWSIHAQFSVDQLAPIAAQLSHWKGQKVEQLTIASQEQSDAILAALSGTSASVSDREVKQTTRKPAAPYTTSTLQQDAVNRLGFSAKRVMQLAQRLYEGGHITYMRTDSVALASVAVEAIRSHVTAQYGLEYLPASAPQYQAKSKGAQEAHEAIRPTTITKASNEVTDDPAQARLYDLIRRRTIASQMVPARLEQVALSIAVGEGIFRATGQRVLFPGFLAVTASDEEAQSLPDLAVGTAMQIAELHDEAHATEPPPRFSEATLIKSLEENGIGRPSTYAPTIDTLSERGYVRIEQRRLIPEQIGFHVTDLLAKHFPEIVDLTFTATMEQRLDNVANGEATYAATLQNFWGPFKKQIDEEEEKIEKVNTAEPSDELCPECGSPMVIKLSRFGKFLACTKFPECRGIKQLQQAAPTGIICPISGHELAEKRSRFGIFYGCPGYPGCSFSLWKKEHLPAKIDELEMTGTEVPFKEQSLAAFTELGLPALPLPQKRVKKESAATTAKPKLTKAAKTATKKAATKKAAAKTTAKSATKAATTTSATKSKPKPATRKPAAKKAPKATTD
jgi:DNA topoisomerase I